MAIREAILAGRPLPVRVIDSHTHVGAYSYMGWYQHRPSMPDTIRCMDRYGIDTIVTAPHALVGGYHDRANEITASLIAEYPGRVWGYVVANPSWDVARAEREIGRYASMDGFVGFKLLPGYQGGLLSPVHECMLECAGAHGMPALTHTWSGTPPFSEVEATLKRYPDTPLLIGHSGGMRESYRETIRLSGEYPNAYLDICGSLYCDVWFEDIVAEAGPEKVLFGTDMINCEARYEIGRVGLADLADEVKAAIFAENFLRLVSKRT